jgi:hypothetical protein
MEDVGHVATVPSTGPPDAHVGRVRRPT